MNTRLDVLLTNNVVADVNKTFLQNITDFISGSYELHWSAMGGMTTASFTLAMPLASAYKLMTNRLGARLMVVSPQAQIGNIVWEGLVYDVQIDDGAVSTGRTLANLYNRVRVVYSPVTYSGTTPVNGTQTATADADYAANQTAYGIRELTYITGGIETTNATQLRDTLLSQYKLANSLVSSVRTTVPGTATVTLTAVGIWETLSRRFYTQTAIAAKANCDVVLKALLTSVGQFVSSDQSLVTANTFQYGQYADGNITAQRFIELLCAAGGTNNRRYYCGFNENGRCEYFEEPITPAYRLHRLDGQQRVYDTTGRAMYPWLVRPGRMIQVDDLMPEASPPAGIANPRTFIVGEVRYIHPDGLEITPQVVDPSQTDLSRLGLIR